MGPDREIERFIRFNARNLAREIMGPRFVIITYRYEKLDHGARVAADNRFGTRSRTITWDVQRQRVRLSRVR